MKSRIMTLRPYQPCWGSSGAGWSSATWWSAPGSEAVCMIQWSLGIACRLFSLRCAIASARAKTLASVAAFALRLRDLTQSKCL